MRILICDDEPLARDRLIRLVQQVGGHQLMGQAQDGVDALNKVRSLEPDVVLIDIEMPGMNGLEAASHIAKLKQPPAIIFCTAYDLYAVQAFQVHAIDYLLKPVRLEDLQNSFERVSRINKAQLAAMERKLDTDRQSMRVTRTHISAKTHRGIELIAIDDIRYFRADQKYVSVRYSGGEVLVDQTLKEFEENLKERFIRVHRNALVAYGYIEALEMVSVGHFEVKLQGVEERIQVSRRHLAGLRKLLKPT